jgi:hypothetical protein
MAALDAATALTAVKHRLGIDNGVTTWDTILADFIVQAVQRLAPKAMREVAPQEVAVSPDSYGEAVVDMSGLGTPITVARQVEASSASAYHPANSTFQHGTELRIQELDSSVSSVRIYGLVPFVIDTVPDELQLAVLWFAISEFYDYLAGNKRKYNVFIQSTGARAVDNMRDESTYFEQKAEVFLDEHSMNYGGQ